MGTQRSHGFETADGGAAEQPAPDVIRSRRALLGAAGGLALATSGLLLPEWLVEETAAAGHPVGRVQKRADKRRDRKHHRLKQKRTQQRHQPNQDGSNAPGAGQKILQMTLRNFTEKNISVSLVTGSGDFWEYEPTVHHFPTTPGQIIGGYQTASDRIGFNIDVYENPIIWVGIDRGNRATKTTWQYAGLQDGPDNRWKWVPGVYFLRDYLLAQAGDAAVKVVELDKAPAPMYKLTVLREKDTRDAFNFTLTLERPG